MFLPGRTLAGLSLEDARKIVGVEVAFGGKGTGARLAGGKGPVRISSSEVDTEIEMEVITESTMLANSG